MKLLKVVCFMVTGCATLWSQLSAIGQISITKITTSPTQAIVEYTSPVAAPCTERLADMNRSINIIAATQSGGQVTAQTEAPHGLLPGAVVYLENSGVWNGWHSLTSVPTSTSFIFGSDLPNGTSGGNAGVLVDDVNPALFAGADQDSRVGNASNVFAGVARKIVLGKRTADVAHDGNRYSRALQAYSRHHLTLTCGGRSVDQEFQSANIPAGDTHNEAPPIDLSNPGQYAYPTVQWANAAQTLIDPLSGLRSRRATSPTGAGSTVQLFVTALNATGAWQNPSAPLTDAGGVASFLGPCKFSTCPLFLRADNLLISGGATYVATGASLDWLTVSANQASISGQCSGDDCKIVACLTVNGVSCTSGSLEATLSSTPANVTFGSGKLMDLWQTSGAPPISRVDVSVASGTVNYSTATKQLSLASGNVFNGKWGPGSIVNVAGAQYTVASIQNGELLTLTSGPSSDLSGVSYSANNFGVLIWKKTSSSNRISIGYTTYLYGSSGTPGWSAAEVNSCSSAVEVAGVSGYNCFIGNELYWLAGDGSDVRDLGSVGFWYFGAGEWSQGAQCGMNGQLQQFDPQNGDVWYCVAYPFFQFNKPSIVQAHYMGSHTQYTGQQIPDCANDGGVQPCIQFTLMQPAGTDLASTAPGFNPDLAVANFAPAYYFIGGISSDGDMLIYSNTGNQDSLGWMFIYTLGDRTPTGTTDNSFRIIASASTYRRAPLSWCTIHFVAAPDDGWVGVFSNDYSLYGPKGAYTMTMTSPALNATPNAPGGPTACPPNPLGVTGAVCTAITVNGQPAAQNDGTSLQNLQVADVIQIGNEFLRVVSIASPTQFTVQRGYTSYITTPGANTLTMACGTRNVNAARLGLWNYRLDPYGKNQDYATIGFDPNVMNAHNYVGGGVFVASATTDGLGNNLCPLSAGGSCYQIRLGDLITASQGQQTAVVYNPPFASLVGIGGTNQVESHPGPCFNQLCVDGRPMVGGGISYPSIPTLGSSSSPFQKVTGQLWKFGGSDSILHRKVLNTIAYVGRWPLLDVSGPKSSIGGGTQDSYKYCIVLNAGECVAGSAAGEVYVNAPYVDYPYCNWPGTAIQNDDYLPICIADLGAHTANMVEVSVANQDVTGAAVRRLGPNYARWNQFDVFWNGFMSPNTLMMGTRVRWLDGVRSDDLITVLPPFAAPDGIQRNNFVPAPVSVMPPPGLGIMGAAIEFGYSEYGPPAAYYCTSRREGCIATSPSINTTNPFSYASESYTPTACSTGCNLTIPALKDHALYFRFIFFNRLGAIVDYGSPQVIFP